MRSVASSSYASVQGGPVSRVASMAGCDLWTWQAARVEVNQEREMTEQPEHPIEERLVQRIVQETEMSQLGRGRLCVFARIE
jgi:hypothetical protein